MTGADFDQRLALTWLEPDSLTVRALRLHLVDGLTMYGAAKQLGIRQSAVGRAKKSFARKRCPACGAAIKSGL